MEGILFLIAWVVISYLFASLKNSAKVAIDPLKIRVVSEKIDEFQVFSVFASGKWQMPPDANSLVFNVRLFQEANNKKLPVMCMIEEWTGNDNIFFSYVSDISSPGTGAIELTREINVISIPIETLKFPFKGASDLVFELNLVSFVNSVPLIFKTATYRSQYTVKEQGYQDRLDGLNKFNENVIKIAAIVSAADDFSDEDERDVVAEWLDDNQIFDNQDNLLNMYDETIDSYVSVEEGLKTVKKLVNEIKDFTSPADKMNILNLLHQISISDQDHNKNEEKLIRYIVKTLEIDEDRYNQMIFKDVKLSTIDSVETDFDELLGLKEDMSVLELKNQLKEQYKIWNQRITSSNIIESKNAKRVLDYISERRADL